MTTIPLNDFAKRYTINGDLICCAECKRNQQVSWASHDFPHRSDCSKAETSESRPWLAYQALIGEAIAAAKPVLDAESLVPAGQKRLSPT